MSLEPCTTCLKPKSTFKCVACAEPVCKSCVQFVDAETFSFFEKKPSAPAEGSYCVRCFEEKARPIIEKYQAVLERAKAVFVFLNDQGLQTRLIRRSKDKFQVADCADAKEVILRLAFSAAHAGYNTIVDVNLKSEKTRDGSYKLIKWRGTATAANVNAEKLDRS